MGGDAAGAAGHASAARYGARHTANGMCPPWISQTPRLARHHTPPRVHCCASLNIRFEADVPDPPRRVHFRCVWYEVRGVIK